MNNLKDYREQPDEGLFENIQRRLRRRRLMRGGGVAAVVVVAVVALVAVPRMTTDGESTALREVAVQQVPAVEVPTDVTATSGVSAGESGAGEGTLMVASVDVPAAGASASPSMPAAQSSVRREAASEMEPMVYEVQPSSLVAEADLPVPVWRAAPEVPAALDGAKDTVHAGAAPVAAKEPLPEEPTDTVANLVWAPNVIVPSDEDERNRTFHIRYSTPVSDFKVYIYSRGGRQVYSSSDPDFRWDGTYQGRLMPQGAYVWVVQFRDSEGRPVQSKGTVTLLR